jgi:hypothetical protein
VGKKKRKREAEREAAEAYDAEQLEEARGPYIGPVERDEALAAIRRHRTGPVVILYPERGFAGGEWRLASGWQNELGGIAALPDEPINTPLEPRDEPIEEPSGSGIFAFSPQQSIPLVTGVAYEEAFVLDLSGEEWTAERYTDGLDVRFKDDLIVRLVFWHEAYHVTEGGEVVPGLGGFRVQAVEVEERDGEADEH